MHERQIKYSLFRNVTLKFKHVCQASLLKTLTGLWECCTFNMSSLVLDFEAQVFGSYLILRFLINAVLLPLILI